MGKRIANIRVWKENMQLKRPYRIAGELIEHVENAFIMLTSEDGLVGLGAASPMPEICGESMTDTLAGLEYVGALLNGAPIAERENLAKRVAHALVLQPAACAAVDIALFDLYCNGLGVPVCDFIGRRHSSMETSVTIGITTLEQAKEELQYHLSNGFKIIKLKIGDDLEFDIALIRKLREWGGTAFRLRVDANQGYTQVELQKFIDETVRMDIELIEQPLPTDKSEVLRDFPDSVRDILAADEDLISEGDAQKALSIGAYGVWNLKLMKTGGITSALRIAKLAERHDVRLMWGCNDESCISISAALHAAFTSAETAFLDLDGSFEIAHDIATGGFEVSDGKLRLTGKPGLGVTLRNR